ncbi:MAG: undecaprenyl-diphosphate phosphatase [Bacteroidia bacterium]|nr:undecaprenyl-diphosphate phosphatase [Bacteroidia bacterium]
MELIEALLLGILQGLTEYLPVSSSGHLQLGAAMLGTESSDNLLFSVIVHAATALSSVVIFRKEILDIIRGLLKFTWNAETQYAAMIVVSMIPVGIIGVFFKDEVKALFDGNITLVGAMLFVTAALLFFSWLVKVNHDQEITFGRALIIGIAQAIAVLPGVSRSGATISTALMIKTDRVKAARFSFLMVIPPIMGEALLDTKDLIEDPSKYSIDALPLLVGFIAAFVTGLMACKAMLSIVNQGKLHYFGFYCMVVGTIALLVGTGVIG